MSKYPLTLSQLSQNFTDVRRLEDENTLMLQKLDFLKNSLNKKTSKTGKKNLWSSSEVSHFKPNSDVKSNRSTHSKSNSALEEIQRLLAINPSPSTQPLPHINSSLASLEIKSTVSFHLEPQIQSEQSTMMWQMPKEVLVTSDNSNQCQIRPLSPFLPSEESNQSCRPSYQRRRARMVVEQSDQHDLRQGSYDEENNRKDFQEAIMEWRQRNQNENSQNEVRKLDDEEKYLTNQQIKDTIWTTPYDEIENQRQFHEAVISWRQNRKKCELTAKESNSIPSKTGNNILTVFDGVYDEEASSLSFTEALKSWRSGKHDDIKKKNDMSQASVGITADIELIENDIVFQTKSTLSYADKLALQEFRNEKQNYIKEAQV